MDRRPSLISIWLQLELCAFAFLLTKGEIRCYCDAPPCAATGYMCKSELNTCFAKVVDPRNKNSPLAHGCSDASANAADVCSSSQRVADILTGALTLECCHDDMCNYRGLRDHAHTRDSTGGRYPYESDNRNLVAQIQGLASTKDVWFRAAVIAVPIAGGLILVLLIMLALRMLRSENKQLHDQRQQMLSRLHYSFHGHHAKKSPPAPLDLECMVPVMSRENYRPTCDKMRQADRGSNKILSLVHWRLYGGRGKLEFV